MIRGFLKFIFISVLIVGLLLTATGLVAGIYFYNRFTRDLPKITRISDYVPEAVSRIYAEDDTLIGEIYSKRRYPVGFDKIPLRVRQAFLAAEDASFYEHPGIDIPGILRAVYKNLRENAPKQGASTITQQIVKSLLLTKKKTYERKIKEVILSYRLEQALTKDEILSIYLNEIYLGSGSHGILAAARTHFRKDLDELTIAESAYLAGLPQKPSYLANPRHRDQAIRRQRYVLEQMRQNQFISAEEYQTARDEELRIYPQNNQTILEAPYFTAYVMRLLEDELGEQVRDPGGYTIHTTLDRNAYQLAKRSVQRGLREVDKRRGWRGPLTRLEESEQGDLLDADALQSKDGLLPGRVYRATVLSVNKRNGIAKVKVGNYRGTVNLKEASWAKQMLIDDEEVRWVDPVRMLKPRHVIEVSLVAAPTGEDSEEGASAKPATDVELKFQLDQTPSVEGAFVVASALTGEVKAVIGGYDYSRSQFNRATQGLRQPGSSFKPFVYLSAIDELGYTPATLVPDSPISLPDGNGEMWSPSNYDRKFLGPMTMRTALQRSRNVVSAFIISKVGVDAVIQRAKALGISTPIGRDLAISLGTSEVKLVDLVRAYGAFAAGGWLADRIVITEIRDRNGNLVKEFRPRQEPVVDENSAFILANMMKGVVERGTAQLLKKLERPVAGKTGTTNDQMDAWFVGYTPEWVAGAWVGFDVKKSIGKRETGGKAAAPIFLYFMQEFLKDQPSLDFNIPDGVIPVLVNLSTGRLADPDDPRAFVEYFKSGTEPRYRDLDVSIPKDYLSNEDF